jgi:hypothetical protein
MPRSKKRTPKVEEVRPYVEGVAKNLVEKLYGPDGPAWGTRLTEIEDVLRALRAILSEKMLDDALARQATARAKAPPPCAVWKRESELRPAKAAGPRSKGRRGAFPRRALHQIAINTTLDVQETITRN